MKEKYEELLERMKEIQVIGEIAQLVGWDTEVMMAKGSIEQRSNQQAFIAKLSHSKITDPEIGRLLKEIQEDSNYDNMSYIEKRNIYLIQRDYDRETKLPPDFVADTVGYDRRHCYHDYSENQNEQRLWRSRQEARLALFGK